MRRESKNTKKKSHHIIFRQSANDMFFHEFIQFTRLLQKKEFDKNILLSYISVD